MKIRNPQWLEIKYKNKTIYGLSQIWFGSVFKRTSGCGPTAAATLLLYLNKRDNGPLPYQNHDVASAVLTLEDVWKFITPGIFGLNSIKKLVKGMKNLFHYYGASWVCHQLRVRKHEPIDKIVSFIEAGLASDCPIAFLNLHAGKSSAFDGWHWIVLIALDSCNDRYIATGYDGGREIKFDLGQWVQYTKIGGGFVYLT